MARRWIIPAALLGGAGLAAAPLGAASAQGDKVTKLNCTLALNAQGGTIECTSTDGGTHKSCTVKSKLTGL